MIRTILATSLMLIFLPACLPDAGETGSTGAAGTISECCWCKRGDGSTDLQRYTSKRECEELGRGADYQSCEKIQVRNSVCVFPYGVPDDSAAKCKCEEISNSQCALVQIFVSGTRRELGTAFKAPDAKCNLALCAQLFSVSYAAECQASPRKQ